MACSAFDFKIGAALTVAVATDVASNAILRVVQSDTMGGEPGPAGNSAGSGGDSPSDYAFQNSTTDVWMLCLVRCALVAVCSLVVAVHPRSTKLASTIFTNFSTLGIACLGGKALAWALSPDRDLGNPDAMHDLRLFFWVALACGAAFSVLEIILFSRLCISAIARGEEVAKKESESIPGEYKLLDSISDHASRSDARHGRRRISSLSTPFASSLRCI